MNDITEPTAGFYRMRLVRGGPPVGIRIFYGPLCDPATGEEMDRAWRWQAEINGVVDELDRVWPRCMGEAIDEAEYSFLSKAQAHARRTDGFNALAQPRRRVDWEIATPPSF